MTTLLAFDNRRINDCFASQSRNRIDNLLGRLPCHLFSAFRAVGNGGIAVEKTQIVVYLRYRGDDRSGVAAGSMLLDGYCRRKPLDLVDFWFLQLVEKLPRIRRKRFHIPSLAFGVEGVESKRRLAATRKSSYDRKRIARNSYVNPFEVVRSRIADFDIRHRSARLSMRICEL